MSAVTSENQSARDASAVASSSLSPPLSVDRRPSAVISSDSQGISIELSVSPPSSSSGSILRRVLPPSNPSEISSNNPSSVTSIAPLSSEQVLLENPNVPGEFSVLSATKGNSVSSISTMELVSGCTSENLRTITVWKCSVGLRILFFCAASCYQILYCGFSLRHVLNRNFPAFGFAQDEASVSSRQK